MQSVHVSTRKGIFAVSFSDWKRVFANAERHLNDGGCFIFDINTQKKLNRLIAEPAWVHEFEDNLLIMDVTAAPQHTSNWNIKVFERRNGNRYVLHEENIREASFPVPQIVSALKSQFRRIRVIDPKRRRASSPSETLYFICKR